MNGEHDLDKAIEEYLEMIKTIESDSLHILETMVDSGTFFSIPSDEIKGSPNVKRVSLYLMQFGERFTESEKKFLKRRIKRVLNGEISIMKENKCKADEARKKQASLPSPHESILQSMVEQLKDLDERQLEAGLGVILKDTLQYLFTAPRSDDILFRELVNAVIAEEQRTKTVTQHRLIYVDPNDPVPTGIVASVVKGERDLGRLRSPKIIHEWTIHPARRFLQKFNEKLKKNICTGNGVYRQFKKGMLGQADLPTAIAATIITGSFSVAAVWYPLAVYIGLIIVKTGLDTYCEKNKPKTKRKTSKVAQKLAGKKI